LAVITSTIERAIRIVCHYCESKSE